jgi:triphosphatase
MKRRARSPRSAEPAATANREIELKLRVPVARLRALSASPLLRASGGGKTVLLAATYYDTPDLQLSRNRIALRVRREGRRWIQAVKGGGSVASGVHTRLELETVLRDAKPDLGDLPESPLTAILHSRQIAAALRPVFMTHIRRSVRLLTPAPGVLIEVAIDRGEIRSGKRREAVCELELELKHGPVTALFDLALRLAEEQPLELEHHSKAARGYALFNPQLAVPLKAAAVQLNNTMDTGDAFRAIAASALAQVHGNARGVLDSADPEYLHQMRVGLRRLRSALNLFRHQLGDSVATQAVSLRTLAAGLGSAREWDVLVTETLPRLRELPQMARLVTACEPIRDRARRSAKKSIKTNDYLLIMLAMGRALVAPQMTAAAQWHEPARVAAARILKQRHAQVLKRGRRLAEHSPEKLHQLRIAIKKLRYAAEFFNDLFQVKMMAVQRARLEKLQDILGSINDAEALVPLLESARVRSSRWPAATADAVVEWHSRRALQQRKRLLTAWRHFCDAPRPWRR